MPETEGEGALLTDAQGKQRLRYHKLEVVDARGQTLPSELDVVSKDRLLISFDDHQAVYPVIVDPLLVNEETKLTIEGDGSYGEYFGSSIAIDGDTMVVGRPETGNAAQGSAYVFIRSGSKWTQQQKLTADDGSGGVEFGTSVAISGDLAVVGAIGNYFTNGAVYVFERTGTTWKQHSKLVPSDSDAGFLFGASIAAEGDTIAAGSDQGSVHIFVREGHEWTESQKLAAADVSFFSGFGHSIALSGDTLVIGAPYETIGGNAYQGSAHIFVRSGTIWIHSQQIKIGNGAEYDHFGHSVAISDSTLAVGAPYHFHDNAPRGSAYVYVRDGSTWTEHQELVASDGGGLWSEFGSSLSILGDTMVIGGEHEAVGDDEEQYSARIFVRDGTKWKLRQKLTSGARNDGFGLRGLALSGNTAIIGAPGADEYRGTVHVFALKGTSWTRQQKLRTTDGAGSYRFGGNVAVDGDTMVTVAPGEGQAYIFVRVGEDWRQQQKLSVEGAGLDDTVAISGNTAMVRAFDESGQGTVHVFERNGTTWTHLQELKAWDGGPGDFFGFSMAILGDTLVVGNPFDTIDEKEWQGSAFVFVRKGRTWTRHQKLIASDGDYQDIFGVSVAISDDSIVVGAPYAAGNDWDQGAAYVFGRNGSKWKQQQKLFARDAEPFEGAFGSSVTLSEDTLVVGAPNDHVNEGGENYDGSAYVFVRQGKTWTQRQKLRAADIEGIPFAFFGGTVVLSGDTLLVGATSQDFGSTDVSPGRVYIFVRRGSAWSKGRRLRASDGVGGDDFSRSIDISGDTIVVGAPLDDHSSGGDAGAVYVYRIASDYGDAPDPGYPTIAANDGARHFSFGPKLGTRADAELDGQPNSGATGDDIAGRDDEDGVSFGRLVAGRPASVDVDVTRGPALLDGWIDFNADGDWADPGERIFDHHVVMDGHNGGLRFAVPAKARVGQTYARLRLSTNGVDHVGGTAVDGEVEDEIVTILAGAAAGATPDPFNFQDLRGVERKTSITSGAARVEGLDDGIKVPIKIVKQTGGDDASYSINGGPFRTGPSTVQNGDRVRLRNRIPTAKGSASVTVSIGGVRDTWDITTAK